MVQNKGIKKGVPVVVKRLQGSLIFFTIPESLFEVRFVRTLVKIHDLGGVRLGRSQDPNVLLGFDNA